MLPGPRVNDYGRLAEGRDDLHPPPHPPRTHGPTAQSRFGRAARARKDGPHKRGVEMGQKEVAQAQEDVSILFFFFYLNQISNFYCEIQILVWSQCLVSRYATKISE